MLEGKNLILATKPYAKENRGKSWLHTASTFLLLCATIAAAAYPFPIAARLVFGLLTSLLLVRLFTIYHDFLHHSILKDSGFAKFMFTIYGYYTLNPSSIWKRSHDYHHKHNSKLHTSSIGSFPIATLEEFKTMTKSERRQYLFIRHPLTVLFGYVFAFLWGMCLLSLIRNPSKHWDSAIAILFHAACGACFAFWGGWSVFLFAFMIPAFISSAMGSYLFYAQHNFPGATFKDKDSWTYAEAAMQSSSYMKMNPLMHWFTGNIGFHHIHHMNARIPFYRLPEAYKDISEFQKAKTTSLNPLDIFRCFQIKVWAPDVNRMIKMSEIKKYISA